MPDWRKYVRERLRLPGLRAEREAEIVEDLAQQMEDLYRGALERGASANEADATAQREVQDWDSAAASARSVPASAPCGAGRC